MSETSSPLRVSPHYAVPPEELRWRVTANRNEEDFLASGKASVLELNTFLKLECQKTLGSFKSILDVGCGCGRILRHLKNYTHNARLFGSDTDPEAIRWCQEKLADMEFFVANEYPPLDAALNQFAFTYAFSVFTHLDEIHQKSWLKELHRVAEAGGLLALTFRDETFVKRLPEGGIKNHIVRSLAQDGFCYMQNPRWNDTFPHWYGGAYHSTAYIREVWGSYFKIITLSPPRGAISQSIALMKKS